MVSAGRVLVGVGFALYYRDKEVVISSETGESATEPEEALKEEAEEGALLNSTGGVSSMRKEAEEASGKAKAMEAKDKRKGKGKVKAKVKDEESGKAEVSVTEEAGRPEESVTEAVTVGSSKSADEVMGKETLQQLLKGTPNRFAMLDPDGDDEKDEMIDRGKSAIEEEHMPSYGMNPSDRGEESVAVGSGKSAMDQVVMGPETEESVTEPVSEDTENEEAATQRALLASNGKLAKKWKKKQKKKAKAEAEAKARDEEAGKAEVSVTEPGRPEESVTEAEKAVMKEAEEGALLVGMDSTGGESSMLKDSEEESGKRSERQLYAEIQRALLDIQEKLKKEKSRKTDKETLQLLKDMSNKLDMLDQGGDDDGTDEIDNRGKLAIDQTCLDTNEDTNTTMVESDKLLLEPLAKEMADEAERFDSYSRLWEYKWRETCGFFTDITVMSSMQFTHYTPGRMPYSIECSTLDTLQIISIKLTGLASGLELPLSVYGVVAVRDMVDRNRNILFCRDMSKARELKQNDPSLHLIGPSRAIVFTDKVYIEIELRVKGRAYSQDKALISCARCYTGGNGPGVSTICFKNSLCTLELCLQPVKQTVQATILGVQVASDDGSWPLEYGGLVACTPLSGKRVLSDSGYTRRINPSSSQIVLIESQDEAMPKGESGHVLLRRQVVSVQLDGRLDVVIKAYSKSGATAAETCVPFYPQDCNISQKKCSLGLAVVTITVAWSLVAASKEGLWFELSGGSFEACS